MRWILLFFLHDRQFVRLLYCFIKLVIAAANWKIYIRELIFNSIQLLVVNLKRGSQISNGLFDGNLLFIWRRYFLLIKSVGLISSPWKRLFYFLWNHYAFRIALFLIWLWLNLHDFFLSLLFFLLFHLFFNFFFFLVLLFSVSLLFYQFFFFFMLFLFLFHFMNNFNIVFILRILFVIGHIIHVIVFFHSKGFVFFLSTRTRDSNRIPFTFCLWTDTRILDRFMTGAARNGIFFIWYHWFVSLSSVPFQNIFAILLQSFQLLFLFLTLVT